MAFGAIALRVIHHEVSSSFTLFFATCNTGVSIKYEVGSRSKKNSRLYEQGAVRPINLGGSGGMLPQKMLKSGGSEMPFPAFWALNYHASTSGNYSLGMAIRCEIEFKKKHSRLQLQYYVLGKRLY